MNIKPIKTSEQHKAALESVSMLLGRDLSPGSDDADYLEIMLVLIEHYENTNHPFDKTDYIDAIKFRMKERRLTPLDMKPVFGNKIRFEEIMNGKRSLTLPMILKLHHEYKIPAESLLAIRSNAE